MKTRKNLPAYVLEKRPPTAAEEFAQDTIESEIRRLLIDIGLIRPAGGAE